MESKKRASNSTTSTEDVSSSLSPAVTSGVLEVEQPSHPIEKVFSSLLSALRFIDSFLFMLVTLYDQYVYNPLQQALNPHCLRISRHCVVSRKAINDYPKVKNNAVLAYVVKTAVIPLLEALESDDFSEEHIPEGRKDSATKKQRDEEADRIRITVFSANVVTYSRTILFVPIAVFLKYSWCIMAFLTILLHDFLDHLDGIVAKCQSSTKKYKNNPILGCFLDAFCDKIVNVFCFWTILLLTQYSEMGLFQSIYYVAVISIVIGYEGWLGVVRVQDYFHSVYASEKGTRNLAASMEGKLKEKLESMGIMFLCLAQRDNNPMNHWAGSAAMVCLLLTIRMAHVSVRHKLEGRRAQVKSS
eukprot:Nk52_evm57s223 gene=Nk52_evmTU57s223